MNKNILLKSKEITSKIESMILFAPNSLSNKLNSKIDKVKMENLFSLEGEYSKTINSLEKMNKLIALTSKPVHKISNSIYKIIDNKIFDINYNFSDFKNSNFKKEWFIKDRLSVSIRINEEDFVGDLDAISKEFDKAKDIVKYLEYGLSEDIKCAMNMYGVNIHIYNQALFRSIHGYSCDGCFIEDENSIYVIIKDDYIKSMQILHHEIGHFIDYFVGIECGFCSASAFASFEDDDVHKAYKHEVEHLYSYAKTNYCEFFAVAYEHRMSKKDFSKLTLTNKVLDKYLSLLSMYARGAQYNL